jgi:archaellum component FlaC
MARFVLIFTILIGLGAAFLGWQTKEQAEALQGNLKEARQNLTTSKASQKKAEDTLKTAQAELTDTQTKLKQAETDMTNAKGEAANAKEALTKATTDLEEKTRSMSALQDTLKKLEDIIGKFGDSPDAIGAKIQELATNNKRLETERDEAKLTADASKKRLEEIEGSIAAKDRTIAEYKQGYVRNALSGRVLAYNSGWGFVIMNLGDKQGIKVGATMVVTRGGAMVGKVKVTSVEPTQSVGDVLPGTVARGDSVQPGDTVVFQGSR